MKSVEENKLIITGCVR